MTKISKTVLASYLIGIITGGVLIHHGMIHNGQIFQGSDFQRSLENLINSHEGIITAILLIGLGVILGTLIVKRK